ncbi:hypothetical protein [Methylobacterium sp. GC_Met_2]|uniref:hypothetical protein n=1 Tax=Methylobacterium sp. GC_Met_2 TaxID=2937376 RepID=UPI00226B97D6|nr:hypothetical protein [Methylobacterium sp. GC_Met_2]
MEILDIFKAQRENRQELKDKLHEDLLEESLRLRHLKDFVYEAFQDAASPVAKSKHAADYAVISTALTELRTSDAYQEAWDAITAPDFSTPGPG